AAHNAGVTVVIVGIGPKNSRKKIIYEQTADGDNISRQVSNINSYLISGNNTIVESSRTHISGLPEFERGNSPTDGGHLLLKSHELEVLNLSKEQKKKFIKTFIGSKELIHGSRRYCLWIEDSEIDEALNIPVIKDRIEKVKEFRLGSKKKATVKATEWAHRFDERKEIPKNGFICVPVISSENRPYLPVALLPEGTVVSNKAFML